VAEEIAVETRVEFRPLSPGEIDSYVGGGEPLDKAGAYGIQGGAAGFVRRVDGSYTNVVGLPVDEVCAALARHGLLDPAGPERGDRPRP
jgi:septum formation protein